MELAVKRGPLRKLKTACLIVAVHSGKTLGEAAQEIDRASRGAIGRVVQRGDLSGKPGECLLLPDVAGIEAERVLLVGAGRRGALNLQDYRRLLGKVADAVRGARVRNAISTLLEVDVAEADLARRTDLNVLAFAGAAYRFDELKSKPEGHALARLGLVVGEDDAGALRHALVQARAKAEGIALARDLANRPGNHCTPTHLAEQAHALAGRHDSLECNVLEEADMETLGMGSLLSVARGSRQPAKLITLIYRGRDDGSRPVVLVGKGVTFDSGGISLKPGAAMDEMKFDMSGAASVLGTLAALAAMGAAINVVGVIPATENLPDGNATKPGDVVRSLSGQTIEILNTDAEGRLILCDALTYSARFDPEVVVDIATLTGACVIALGEHASGLLANDDALAEELLAAGQRSGDRAWRLPLWEDYQKQLDSNFADMANVGGRSAGTITAACFLARFTRDYRWAHLDIAGTAWASGKSKGSTGRPVPLLLEFLLQRARRA